MNQNTVAPLHIRQLPREIAEKIAAGEIIERPASVVKELVENAVDAGATHVQIELEDGGKRTIRVTDNGCGILADEIPLALERHATSKIQKLDDLWNLHTMGFRGEALPSIASISHLTLESRTHDTAGRALTLEGGRQTSDKPLTANAPVPRPSGTRISVEHLFFNVPARLKFLKAKSSESSTIRDLIERLALCQPHMGFTLMVEGRKTLTVPAGQNPLERFAEILEISPQDVENFETHYDGITIRGLWDREHRGHNSQQVYMAVNGRMVRDRSLQQSCVAALRPVMMEGEFPRLFLEILVPPGDVDANVHPTKIEVRFRRTREVFQLIHTALGQLAARTPQAFYKTELSVAERPVATASVTAMTTPAPQQHSLFSAHEAKTVYKVKEVLDLSSAATSATDAEPDVVTTPTTSWAQIDPSTATGFSSLHYIGQLKNTYLLFQDVEGLILIDQHAAHERINYEKIKARFFSEGLISQPLLLGATYKCSPEEVALILDAQEMFLRFGFEVEAFGDKNVIIRGAPQGLEPHRVLDTFAALVEVTKHSDERGGVTPQNATDLSPRLERMLATAACHGSVRAGQSLSPLEARALIAQMESTPSSLNCPHGRPASVRVSFAQIEGLFKRS